jgi:hypothetical protein
MKVRIPGLSLEEAYRTDRTLFKRKELVRQLLEQ